VSSLNNLGQAADGKTDLGNYSASGHSLARKESEVRGRAEWTREMERTLIHALLKEVQKGKRAESGFKKEAWASVHEALKERYQVELSVTQVKNKVTVVRYTSSLCLFYMRSQSALRPPENIQLITNSLSLLHNL
jgi:hypothetical protein